MSDSLGLVPYVRKVKGLIVDAALISCEDELRPYLLKKNFKKADRADMIHMGLIAPTPAPAPTPVPVEPEPTIEEAVVAAAEEVVAAEEVAVEPAVEEVVAPKKRASKKASI